MLKTKYLLYTFIKGVLGLIGFLLVFFFISPSNFIVVLLFLTMLFITSSHLLSILIFLVRFRGEQRVWYLKEDDFQKIYVVSFYISIGIVLILALSYFSVLSIYTLIPLLFLLGTVFWLQKKQTNAE